jgi:GlcNAc-PI de-N-acetylase
MAPLREQLRHERYDEIYVSPHMDDAAYSCGGRILQERRAGRRVLVITLFGTGKGAPSTTVGGSGGSALSDYAQRSAEEEAVMAALDADFVWVDYPELLFRPKRLGELLRFLLPYLPLPPSPVGDDLFALLAGLIAQRLAPGGSVYFPLGVGFHPDHRLVTDVGRALHGLGVFPVLFYEDVPYSTVRAFVTLRLSTLGFDVQAPLGVAARTINHFVFRTFGWVELLSLPVVWTYLACVRVAGALLSSRDAGPGEPRPVLEARDIAGVLHEKVAVMGLYPSQTALFFEPGEGLYEALRIDGLYEERCWRFPPFADARARLRTETERRSAERLMTRFGA